MSIESIDIGTETFTEAQEIKTEEETFLFAALVDLQNTCHLFLRKTDDNKLDGENGYTRFYDVIDTYGMRIFQCIEKTPVELRKPQGQEGFLIVLVDARGETLFEYEGEIDERFDMIRANHIWGGVTRKLTDNNRKTFPIEFWKLNDEGMPMSDTLVRESSDLPQASAARTILKKRTKEKKPDKPEKVKEKRKTVIFAERIESPREVLFVVGEKFEDDVGCCGCKAPVPPNRLDQSDTATEAEVMLPDKTTRVGRISKHWSSSDGIQCEKDEIENLIGIHFPKRTDVRIKALLVGVLFMLDIGLYTPRGP